MASIILGVGAFAYEKVKTKRAAKRAAQQTLKDERFAELERDTQVRLENEASKARGLETVQPIPQEKARTSFDDDEKRRSSYEEANRTESKKRNLD